MYFPHTLTIFFSVPTVRNNPLFPFLLGTSSRLARLASKAHEKLVVSPLQPLPTVCQWHVEANATRLGIDNIFAFLATQTHVQLLPLAVPIKDEPFNRRRPLTTRCF